MGTVVRGKKRNLGTFYPFSIPPFITFAREVRKQALQIDVTIRLREKNKNFHQLSIYPYKRRAERNTHEFMGSTETTNEDLYRKHHNSYRKNVYRRKSMTFEHHGFVLYFIKQNNHWCFVIFRKAIVKLSALSSNHIQLRSSLVWVRTSK